MTFAQNLIRMRKLVVILLGFFLIQPLYNCKKEGTLDEQTNQPHFLPLVDQLAGTYVGSGGVYLLTPPSVDITSISLEKVDDSTVKMTTPNDIFDPVNISTLAESNGIITGRPKDIGHSLVYDTSSKVIKISYYDKDSGITAIFFEGNK